jgi:hypothetical protein
MNDTIRVSYWIPALALAWLTVAVAAAATGRLAALPPPQPQAILIGLTSLLVIMGFAVPPFRAWLGRLAPRALIAIHLVRFVGLVFLWMSARGALPREFAVPAGVGDVVVAALAVALLVTRESAAWYRAASAWNVLGLADILMVVVTATRVALEDPTSMTPLLRLPLSLLPTFIVPVIIASHLWLFGRLRRRAAIGSGSA